MDLFAALFTFPVSPAPVQAKPLPQSDDAARHDLVLSALPSEITEGEALDVFFAEAAIDQKNKMASLLSGQKEVVNSEVNETLLFEPITDSFLHFGPRHDIRKSFDLLETPVKPPPDKDSLNIKPIAASFDGETPLTPPDDRYMPPIHGEKDITAKVDLVPEDVFDYPSDIEVLEIPSRPPKPPMAVESERILEISNEIAPLERASTTDQPTLITGELETIDQVVNDAPIPESSIVSDVLPVNVSVNIKETGFAPAPMFPHVAMKTTITIDAKTQQPSKPAVSLLETFTNNVFAESKPVKPLLTEFSELSDLDDVFGETQKSADELQNTEHSSEFSFGSSLGGEAINERIDDPLLTDTKAKRLILDQVGSTLNEMAAALQKDGAEKSVLKIRLKPAELGTVEVTLAKNADGVLEAHFQTDSPHTQNILNESLAALRESLENSGIKVGSLDTSCTTFLSGGNEGKRETAREFPVGDERPVTAPTFENDQRSDDEKQSRLVNLRA